MQRLKFLILLLACATPANAGQGFIVGNGGSPLGRLILQGRAQAESILIQLERDDIGGASGPLSDWLLINRERLAADLLLSQLIFVDEWPISCPTNACACTLPNAASDIYISYGNCERTLTDAWMAGELLLHEAVHHMGVTDENFAYEAARAVYRRYDISITPEFKFKRAEAKCLDAIGRSGLNPGKLGPCGLMDYADVHEIWSDRGTPPQLFGASFRWANLSQLEIARKYFDHADLSHSDLSFAKITLAEFTRATLAAADLRFAVIDEATFEGADLSDAILEDASIKYSDFTGASFVRGKLARMRARFSNFEGTDMTGADFTDSDLGGSLFTRSKLAGASFRNADICGADFRSSDLADADLQGARACGTTRLPFSSAEALARGIYTRPAPPNGGGDDSVWIW